MATERTAPGLLGRVTFTYKKTGRSVTYELPQAALPLMQTINQEEKGVGRYHAVMNLDANLLYRIDP